MITATRSILLLGVIVLTLACASKVEISPDFKKPNSKAIAILPTTSDEELTRENKDYLDSRLRSLLEEKNWFVVSAEAVNRVCSEDSCPESQVLKNKFGVQFLAQLTIENISTNDFFLAHYNTIAGKLDIRDISNQSLYQATVEISQRGGLIFQSGQVLKGIRESIADNDTRFAPLAESFVQEAIKKLPKIDAIAPPEQAAAPTLDTIQHKRISASQLQICAAGAKGNFVSILFNNRRAGMREDGNGNYCGIFNIGALLKGNSAIRVEAKSPYGSRVSKELDLAEFDVCSLKNKIVLDATAQGVVISVQCPLPNQTAGPMTPAEVCADIRSFCPNVAFEIFRATDGVFTCVARTTAPSWVDKSTTQTAEYRVLAVSNYGFSDYAEPAIRRIAGK